MFSQFKKTHIECSRISVQKKKRELHQKSLHARLNNVLSRQATLKLKSASTWNIFQSIVSNNKINNAQEMYKSTMHCPNVVEALPKLGLRLPTQTNTNIRLQLQRFFCLCRHHPKMHEVRSGWKWTDFHTTSRHHLRGQRNTNKQLQIKQY